MLPKKEKFSSRDFSNKNLFRNSQKIYTQYGFFVVLENYINPYFPKAIVLSKKNFKTAVLRNKYKRLFCNTLLEVQRENISLKQKAFIFYPKQFFSKEELREDLKKL